MASDLPVDRRAMRKRGLLRLVDQEIGEASAWVDRNTARRLRRINAVSATAFVFGGFLFAIGAGLAQAGAAPTLYCSVYLAGGILFSTGGYATVLQAVNGPRGVGEDGRLLPRDWHWWANEPHRIEWMSSFALFFGTIVFAINIVDSFIGGLGAAAEDRLVWSPDMIGCLLFLISGFLAMREIGPGLLFWSRRRDQGWWIVAVNQLGSVLFLVSAVASFVRPSSGEELAVGIANWGTLTGALCFAVAGAIQEFERPAAQAVMLRRPPGGAPGGGPRRTCASRRRSSPRSGR